MTSASLFHLAQRLADEADFFSTDVPGAASQLAATAQLVLRLAAGERADEALALGQDYDPASELGLDLSAWASPR